MQANYIFERQLGYQQVTGLNTFKTLTIPPGTQLILMQPESQSIRWLDDGNAPTAAVGYPLAAGAELQYTCCAKDQANIKLIEQAASAKVNVKYYGAGEY